MRAHIDAAALRQPDTCALAGGTNREGSKPDKVDSHEREIPYRLVRGAGHLTDHRPSVFSGSSSDALRVAQALKSHLNHEREVRLLTQGVRQALAIANKSWCRNYVNRRLHRRSRRMGCVGRARHNAPVVECRSGRL